MELLFKSVLLLSCVGGILAGLLLLARPLIKRIFSPQWQYGVWFCVLIVMLLPVRFDLPHSAAPVMPQPAAAQENVSQTDTIVPAVPAFQASTQPRQTANMPSGVPDIFAALVSLWLAGALGFFCASMLQYLRFLSVTRRHSSPLLCPKLDEVKAELGIRRHIRVRVTACTSAPMMVGLFRATLLLPDTLKGGTDLMHVLLHELTHVKRGDLTVKWFAMLVRCVHWFNPLVYRVCRELDEACEMSCDLAVTWGMDGDGKRGYMGTILSLAAPGNEKTPRLATSMASGRRMLERRFTMIRNVKQPSRLRSALSFLVALALLSSTVFASGVAASAAGLYTQDNSVIEVYNGDTKLTLTNKPFVENYEIYLPLRETLNQFGITDIQWSNGRVDIALPLIEPYQGAKPQEPSCWFILGSNRIQYPSDEGKISYRNGVPDPTAEKGYPLRYPPVVRDGVTYATVEFFENIIFAGQIPNFYVRYIQSTDPKDYYAEGEEVFVGTAEEQERFNPVDADGNRRYVKRIVTNEQGEAMFVMTVENQKPEVIASFDGRNSASMEGYSKVTSRTFIYNAYGVERVLSCGIYAYERTGENSFADFAYIPPALQINCHAYHDFLLKE